MNNRTVTLDRNEIYIGAIIGVRRMLESWKSKECNKVKNKDFGWHSDIEAACAELAFAKWMGVYWDFSVNTFKKPDVAGYQVRHCQSADGSLIVRPNDSNSENYVLVVGTTPEFKIIGWIKGEDAKTTKHDFKGYNGMPDCWMVKQEFLNNDFSDYYPNENL
jgi:hypothetical protein